MSDALAAWEAKGRTVVTLPTGTHATIHLPDIQEHVISGAIQMPVLAAMAKLADKPEEVTPEQVAEVREQDWLLIIEMVDEVEGQPITLTMETVRRVPIQDREKLRSYALRVEALPPPNGAAPKSQTEPDA